MQTDTLGVLVWAGVILGYAWSVRNLARLSRRPSAGDADGRGTLIVVEGTQRSGDAPGAAAHPTSTSQRQASGSPS